MHENGVEYKVGLLMVSAVFLFAAFVFVLGRFSLSGGYTLYVDYDYSGNVQAGAPVKVSGITVGRVEEVEFKGGKIDPKTNRRVQVRVELWIENRARDSIRGDAEFFVNTAGVLGEQYVEVVPGKDWDAPPLAPGTVVVGVNPPRTDLVVARLYELLDMMTEVMRRDRDKITRVISRAADAVDHVDAILVENRGKVGALVDAVTGLAIESQQVLAKVDESLDPRVLAKTMRDADQLLVTADQTLATAGPATGALMREGVRVLELATEARVERTLVAVDKAGQAADEAGTLLRNTNGVVSDLRAGKGSIGALLTRLDVYADVREMVRDLRRNPWKLIWKE
ncbi:MAG TPA: MlaD family protein [Kofleriaceae bacterium]|jgi:phospholipid/cholesterol/gamma-HCH transport system substrate-binding protein|nr:MlaD family protein [Kofleriaceae bacterium]